MEQNKTGKYFKYANGEIVLVVIGILIAFSINNSDVVTRFSESLKKDTLRLFNITKEIHVIHNFIDFEKFPDSPSPL